MKQELEPVLVRDVANVRVVAMNRPERKNALDSPARLLLLDALQRADADPAVRAIVLTGAAGNFSSGADVTAMGSNTETSGPRQRLVVAQDITRTIACGGTPVIAAVEGIAFGAGLGIALACDHVVAARDARFSAAFLQVGLSSDFGVLWTLPHRIGLARARTMLLLGEMVTADDGLPLGLVDAVADPGTALDAALPVAEVLASRPTLAVAALKRGLQDRPRSLDETLEREIEEQVPLLLSHDHTEAVAAFRERRTPRFEGT